MRQQGKGGNIVLITQVLGERGLPNCSVYAAAHGAVFNFIRALAQEVAAERVSVNGIELGWMDWMTDRIDPSDEEAQRALRFTMSKRAGTANDVGPIAVWLSGSGVGFVTGQIFALDGGLTQHL
jgi:NAD(P)-dependent dehydrogenase (short-subunit alcohol dehydrogenase family)